MTTDSRFGSRVGWLALLMAGGFLLGACFVHWEVFPYSWVRTVLRGYKSGETIERQMVQSRSPTLELALSLPYAPATYDPRNEDRGILRFVRDRSEAGLNLYSSRTSREAILMDMKGKSLHRWAFPTAEEWQHVELLPNGDLLVMIKDREVFCLDVRSRLLWRFEARVHHDLWVQDDKIYVLTRRNELRPEIHLEQPLVVDELTVLSSTGELLDTIDLLSLVQTSIYQFLVPVLRQETIGDGLPLDLLHINHVEILDGRREDLGSRFGSGKALLSSRNLNAIFIADLESKTVEWLWGPSNLVLQHHPSLLEESGTILLFDNGLEASRILEMDALSNEIVWEYAADGFFSRTRGSVERLPGGNTLITESDPGYAFEVTPSGEVVWEFANPDVDVDGLRSAIFRLTRFFAGDLEFVPDEVFEGVGQS